MTMKKIYPFLLFLIFGFAYADQSFPDNEARKAILDLRADVKLTKDELKKSFERIESQKLASDLELKKANDLIVRLDLLMQQLKNDSLATSERLQKEINKIIILRKQDLDQQNQAVLLLRNEIEGLKQQSAESRGDRELLTNSISLVQRNQSDASTETTKVIEILRRDIDELRGEKDLLFKEIELLRGKLKN